MAELKSFNVRTKNYAEDTLKAVDVKALENKLRNSITGEVRFDDGSRALYATDSSNYRQVPIGVVIPRTKEDIIKTVSICREFHAPILSRGGGTSLAGQCCNVAVVMDMSKYYNKILNIDYVKHTARVQPGLVLDELRKEAEKKHLTFGPDPSTHSRCTLGGMMGNNSCGVHSMMAGKTEENVLDLEVLTYEGEIYHLSSYTEDELVNIINQGGKKGDLFLKLKNLREKYADLIRAKYPKIPRRVSGYNLPSLLPENRFDLAKALVGSEGTCVVILEATLRLVHSPPFRSLLVIGYPSIFETANHIEDVLKASPIGLEAIDDFLVENMKKKGLHPEDVQLLPDGKGWLLTEFGGDSKEESDAKARELMAALKKSPNPPTLKLFTDKKEEETIWIVRESGLGATAQVPGEKDTWEGWEDSAVPPEHMGAYLPKLQSLFQKYGYKGALYGHFGQGCLHTRIDFDLLTEVGIKKYRGFLEEAADLVVSLGGSLSGEHGDGQSRAELLPRMFGNDLIEAFAEFKRIWDPQWQMNPGKIVFPYRLDENLRYGKTYAPPVLETHFKFPEDKGGFAHAMTRCVGVGACRRHDSGVMCPSYMVTREEKHSTRGRARLLFEMLGGQVIKKGWRDKSVKEALDLCLSCKGCKGDCPVNVDMATYKAEFLSHYYKNRLRPRSAYAFGLIGMWARLATPFARIINFVTQNVILGKIAKFLAGVSPHRQIPEFATENFHTWFSNRKAKDPQAPPVILWADTFNTYFHPEVAKSAVEVLEDAGYRVVLPKRKLCCGRPLYDYGMLVWAKKWLMQILVDLKDEIRDGIPFVGLEPSCTAVFRDELKNLLPDNIDAKRLSEQSFIFSEFLEKIANYTPPVFHKTALIQGHCHHKSIFKMDSESSLLKKMGMNFKILDSGCCGMAGGFGFEKNHYDISMKAGERILLPAVREADPATVIIANGFSCREQIKQGTGRIAMHLSQIISAALAEEKKSAGQKMERGKIVGNEIMTRDYVDYRLGRDKPQAQELNT